MKKQKYVALYCRTSTKHQEKGLETQERLLKRYCEYHQIKEYKVFSDFNYSGRLSSRPKLDEMMSDVREGNVSQIVILNLSRISRSLKSLLLIIEELQDYQTGLVSISENLSIEDTYGRLIVSVLGAVNQMLCESVSVKTKQGLFNAKEKGIQLGRTRTISHEKIVETAKVTDLSVRAIARLHGCSPSSVSRILSGYRKQTEHN